MFIVKGYYYQYGQLVSQYEQKFMTHKEALSHMGRLQQESPEMDYFVEYESENVYHLVDTWFVARSMRSH